MANPVTARLLATFDLHGKPLSPEALREWLRLLQGLPVDHVLAALDAHAKHPERGRFPPKPADVFAFLEARSHADGRPGPDEAWPIALQAANEARSLVWTEEMAGAWGVARFVFDEGDEVGARMAFREAYVRLVADARAHGRTVRWFLTRGTSDDGRDAIEQAVELGRLPPEARLPAPQHAAALLEGPEPSARGMSRAARQGIAALKHLRERMTRPADDGLDLADVAHTAELKAAAQRLVDEHRARDDGQ